MSSTFLPFFYSLNPSMISSFPFCIFFLLKRLRQELYARLLLDDDWKEVIQRESRQVLHNDNNEGQPSQVTLDELSSHLFQRGLESAPGAVVEKTKMKIREACRSTIMDRR